MSDFHKLSEGILGEETTEKTNTELFLSLVGQYFPEAIKDGEVDFTALKEEMGEFAAVSSEHYDFTWAGKQAAKKEAMSDIYGRTLKYKPQDSLNPDTTENIYIEGDNLEALKLLRRNYHGKIKMIYIDPPYNTGSDFVYHDDFSMTEEELAEKSGDVVDGVRYQKNGKDGSRYHTNWLNMMYPRLKIARELLSDDGVIFISIDDNEVGNLRKLCDIIFGDKNFRGQISRATGTPTGQGTDRLVSEIDYILLYSKSEEYYLNGVSFSEDDEKIYNLEDEYGRYLNRPLRKTGGEDRREDRPSMYYSILAPDDTPIYPIAPSGYQSRWRCSEARYKELVSEHRIDWKYENDIWKVYQKFYLEGRTKQVSNLWTGLEGNKKATITIKQLLNKNLFDFPKPVEVLKQIQIISTEKDSIILDFFSGSATTAHAVMQLNAEDGGNRKFILVQLPEVCDEKSEAAKAGYRTICEIGKERIRRAAKSLFNNLSHTHFCNIFPQLDNITIS